MMRHASHLASRLALLGLMVASHGLLAEEVAVVSAKSTITRLTKTQVTNIFLGKTTRFPDGSAAVPIDQSEGTLARDEFYTRIAGKSAAQMKAYWSKIIFTGRGQPPKSVPSSGEAKRLIEANLNAIGYIEPKFVDDAVRVVVVTQE